MRQSFFKRHKKLIIIGVIIIVAVAAFFIHKKLSKPHVDMEAMSSGPETGTVTRQTISNYVSMTGTIAANDSQTVYSTINNLEVLSVRVKVGDYVNAGDVVATLDSSDYEKKLASARTSLSVQQSKSALTVAKAEKAYNQAVEDAATAAKTAGESVADSQKDFAYNEGDKDDAYSDWQDALEDYEDAKKDYDEAHKKYKKLKKNKDSVKFKGVTYYYEAPSDDATAKTVSDLKSEVEKLETARDNAEDSATKQERAYISAVHSLEKQYRTYNKSLEDQEDKEKEYSRKIESAAQDLYSARLDASNASDELKDRIEEYEKNIDKCSIKAPISGVVTSVKMEVGDETDGDNNVICVINDTSSYKVEGTVDEYDIAKLSEGMKAVIKTESTDDVEMTGVVTFVSPTPESSSSGSGSGSGESNSSSGSAAYSVKVLIDELDKDVRIGMTAETNILTKTAEDALTVPYECITQNLNGDYVVYAVSSSKVTVADEDKDKPGFSKEEGGNEEGGRGGPGGPGGRGGQDGEAAGGDVSISQIRSMGREIVVEKILEADYYTAVTGEGLEEGMEVYVVSSASEEETDFDDMGMMMFP